MAFRQSFARDLKRIKDRAVLQRVKQLIEGVEETESLQEVGNVTKLAGTDNYFRIRVERIPSRNHLGG